MKQLTGLGVAIAAGVKVGNPLQMGGDAPKGAMLAKPPASPSDVVVTWTDNAWREIDNPTIDKDGNVIYTGNFVNY